MNYQSNSQIEILVDKQFPSKSNFPIFYAVSSSQFKTIFLRKFNNENSDHLLFSKTKENKQLLSQWISLHDLEKLFGPNIHIQYSTVHHTKHHE